MDQISIVGVGQFCIVGNTKIFVFWAGVHEPTLLSGLADLQITGAADVKTELERFFRSLGVSLSGVQVLEVGGP